MSGCKSGDDISKGTLQLKQWYSTDGSAMKETVIELTFKQSLLTANYHTLIFQVAILTLSRRDD